MHLNSFFIVKKLVILFFLFACRLFSTRSSNQIDNYCLSIVFVNRNIDKEHAFKQLLYRQKTSQSFLSFCLSIYCLQDLLNQKDNYRLSNAFANKNIEKNKYLNNIFVNKKTYLFFILLNCLFKTSCIIIVYRFINLQQLQNLSLQIFFNKYFSLLYYY